jgi:mannitol/fructose-specific phosphotransferase system IIA component (Ntr-type)
VVLLTILLLLPGALTGGGSVTVLITGGIALVAVFVKLDVLVEAASTVFVLGYVLASLSVVILRESGLQNYRPSFRVPLYPWLQLVTIIGFAFVLLEMGESAFVITAVLATASFCVYWFYGRRQAEKESALLHLISRITARDFGGTVIESELKEIVRERDEIALDRFDTVVEKSIVLDLDRSMALEAFFKVAAAKLASRVSVDPDRLLQLLIEREKDTSTVLSPTLAVPHIVIEGENKFDILIARCRKGVRFSDKAPAIHTIFVIAGSKDQRNFYLRVLAAIAQIVQDPEFDRKWMAARNEQALRDVVLLAPRRRGH